MRTLYLDCHMGAAGDMLTAALIDLLPDPDGFVEKLNSLNIPGVVYKRKRRMKNGVEGTYISVLIDGVSEACGARKHGEEPCEQKEAACGHAHSDSKHEHSDSGYGHGDSEHGHSVSEHRRSDSEHEHNVSEHRHGDCEHGHGAHIPMKKTHVRAGKPHSHGGAASMHKIEHLVRDHLNLPKKIQDEILCVYEIIAEAESKVHGVPVSDIHFHEVGSLDAVADIAAVCLLFEALKVEEVVASPVHVGSGHVRCAHGILPVPAPATAHILEGIPIYGGKVQGELCTPTGAALLKRFVTRFGAMPVMKVEAVGYGMGTKDFEEVNCVRAMIGEAVDDSDVNVEEIYELCCNLDDMNPEAIGYASERLFEAGALDVYTLPIGMKKNRPGTLLGVICRVEDKQDIIRAIFKHTSTLGIRENLLKRHTLKRRIEEVDTPHGRVRKKTSFGYGTVKEKFEYDDVSRIAQENGISLSEAESLLNEADPIVSGNDKQLVAGRRK